MEKLPLPNEDRTSAFIDSTQQDLMTTSYTISSKSGGGEMGDKLIQQHQLFASIPTPVEPLELLPNVSLPISTLPTINFDTQSSKNTKDVLLPGRNFEFSNPIEVLPKQTESPVFSEFIDHQLSQFCVKTDTNHSDEGRGFTFSRPIELDMPFPLPSTTTSGVMSNSATFWECSSCWIRNPVKESKCAFCEAPRSSFSSTGPTLPAASTEPIYAVSAFASSFNDPPSTWECSSCWIRNSQKESKCLACAAPRPVSSVPAKTTTSGFGDAFASLPSTWECSGCWISNSSSQTKCRICETLKNPESAFIFSSNLTTAKSGFGEKYANLSSTWECNACWVRNPAKEAKCLACETTNPSKTAMSEENVDNSSKSVTNSFISPFSTSSGAASGFSSSPFSSSTPSSGFKIPTSLNGCPVSFTQTLSFGGFKIPVSKSSDAESTLKMLTENKDSSRDSQSDTAAKTAASSSKSSDTAQSVVTTNSTMNTRKRERDTGNPYNLNDPSDVSLLCQKRSKASEGFSSGSPKKKTNTASSFKPDSTLQSSTGSSIVSGKTISSEVFAPPGSWECDICLVLNCSRSPMCWACEAIRATKQNSSGFAFKSLREEKPNLLSTTTLLNFGPTTTTSVASLGASIPALFPVFGETSVKTEPVNTVPTTFAISSATTSTSNGQVTAQVIGFQAPQSSTTPVILFGAQPSSSTAPQFGSTNSNFTFGSNNETANPLSQPAPISQEIKQAAVAAKPFTFGAATQGGATPSSSFQPQFNINIPPSFNFGAESTQPGPFQFAANSDSVSQSSEGVPREHRRILKAVRRIIPKR